MALIVVLALLMAIFTGCAQTKVESKLTIETPSIFVVVESTYAYKVVYDRETKVMYTLSDLGYGSGHFTLLVNQDGSPKLWKGQ